MSSRDTFVTSFLYDKDAAIALEKVLSERGAVHNHGEYLSGMIHSGCNDYMDIYDECVKTLQASGYDAALLPRFQLVIICDDWGTVEYTEHSS